MDREIGIIAAFTGGALSFLAPCVLPLIPGYLSFISGVSTAEMRSGQSRSAVMVPSALFVAGFTAVFVLMGAGAGFASLTLRPFFAAYGRVLTVASGAIIAAFGILLTGIVPVPWLYREARADLSGTRKFGRAAAFVMGAAFGFGWTPCVGPILAVILGLAAQTGDVARAALLLLAYSAGLGIPFLLTAALFSRLEGLMRFLNRHSLFIARVAGVILVIMGVTMATGQLGRLSSAIIRLMPFLARLG